MEKELLSQLNKLKNIKPDTAWKNRNREILLSQISSSTVDKIGFFDIFAQKLSLLRYVSQPVMAVFLIAGVLLGGGFFSLNAAKDTKPGDSLYIAKIISEKTQFALTFNEKKKVKLGIEFAGNRAKEITQVLSEEGDVEIRVEKLKDNFKKEIAGVKTRLENINNNKIAANTNIKTEEEENMETSQDASPEEEGEMVFSAGLGKEEKGIQVSENNTKEKPILETTDEGLLAEENINSDEPEKADQPGVENPNSDTGSSSEDVAGTENKNPQTILEKVEELLDNDNYDETMSRLAEIGEMIDQVNSGEVKGEYDSVIDGDSATSTVN
ncbi:hypothetical protein A2331_06570 [Candidatus Falkowbacteria bacterium RIFOXYB2_FULL_34_18]|uniref:DUF5667 domain-containing protein n=1 Tax=Candidatus Falkowbacteria bacterium RIFOXYD2_FULL_34_120 TaxID=1798007 RepID=A0A1F5TR80_9BACT|nr:MAG: hypothetical protein A2331_06570 [Candidatus Falkowbacteria bacterium RIFOXYB2_FULL_34_18]OGF30015.1 MAG: hypothetical protein A2500_04110 [Candidatus Falkowbacteria bacterium RIFOXYC12_FULL_34_55]OGF37128.1 MAG: hypothetical protein A2466_02410 [Candidatus Falkowbacteria bacterium RIFOXYC2_FULL_34_220]OGF39551.1 MAG: hypothetical protein A2515_04475 [Candidatus Falkowbacteria bacterium RIFOXYD12_FULL_34_57]OGF41466.1 MAG: hypothetical protein A2531_02125 [Candidatus Falkowbacteria bact